MNKGIELWTINKWLRKIGLVLVVLTSNDGPTRLWIEWAKTFDNRSSKNKDPFYENTLRDPTKYCKCGKHFFHKNYNDWIGCDADGRPITKFLDHPDAYHIPNPECCKGRGPDLENQIIEDEIENELIEEDKKLVWEIHKNCNHLPYADCVCPEEITFDRDREVRRFRKRRARGLK